MKEKLKYYTVKTLIVFSKIWLFLCSFIGIIVTTECILGGFKITLGKRVVEFDGLFDIFLLPIINWFYKI